MSPFGFVAILYKTKLEELKQARVAQMVACRLVVQEIRVQTPLGENYYEQILLSVSPSVAFIVYLVSP